MTVQDMIDNVKNNLGNRATGRIGSTNVDIAVLQILNYAVPYTVIESQPDYYNREGQIYLETGAREYYLPSLDTDGNTIRIKDIYSHRCTRGPITEERDAYFVATGTDVPLTHLNYLEFVNKTSVYNQQYTGTPSCYALWGKDNKLHLDYFPSENLLLQLYVEVYPNEITESDLQLDLPVQDQWAFIVEAFATKIAFLKLQQSLMYSIWDDIYQRHKEAITRTEYEKQSHSLYQGYKQYDAASPALNPLYHRWNS